MPQASRASSRSSFNSFRLLSLALSSAGGAGHTSGGTLGGGESSQLSDRRASWVNGGSTAPADTVDGGVSTSAFSGSGGHRAATAAVDSEPLHSPVALPSLPPTRSPLGSPKQQQPLQSEGNEPPSLSSSPFSLHQGRGGDAAAAGDGSSGRAGAALGDGAGSGAPLRVPTASAAGGGEGGALSGAGAMTGTMASMGSLESVASRGGGSQV